MAFGDQPITVRTFFNRLDPPATPGFAAVDTDHPSAVQPDALDRRCFIIVHFRCHLEGARQDAVASTECRVRLARLDQYDEKGQPVCLTRGVFQIAADDNNDYPYYGS